MDMVLGSGADAQKPPTSSEDPTRVASTEAIRAACINFDRSAGSNWTVEPASARSSRPWAVRQASAATRRVRRREPHARRLGHLRAGSSRAACPRLPRGQRRAVGCTARRARPDPARGVRSGSENPVSGAPSANAAAAPDHTGRGRFTRGTTDDPDLTARQPRRTSRQGASTSTSKKTRTNVVRAPCIADEHRRPARRTSTN